MKLSLFKCHYYHIISKITLCSLLLIYVLLIIEKVLISTSIGYKQTSEIRSITYFFSVFETEKIFSLILFVFIYGVSFSSNNDSYRSFILTNNVSRNKYFITKYITILLILFIYIIMLLFSTILICYFFEIKMNIDFYYSYLSLFLLVNFYGLLSTILILVFNNYYLVTIPFILYILISSLDVNKPITYISILIDNHGVIYNGYLYGLFLIFFILLINLYLYNKIDLQSL